MAAYERAQISTLFDRLREKPQRLTIVTGPRQTGKTTLVHQVLGQLDGPSRYVSVDEPDTAILPPTPVLGSSQPEFEELQSAPLDGSRDARWLVMQWEQARLATDCSDRGLILAIDEIQKIPNWSETVKGLWDADRRSDRHLHVILLGSAPLLMQQGLSESLAGRYETVRLMHWSFAEMSAAFGIDLQRYVYFGGYPGGAPLIPEQSRWRVYIAEALVEPNIERDILAMQRVDKPALLKRLFQLGAEYSGQILSFNKMLGQLQDAGNTTTLARYLDLLSNAGLITGLPKYGRRGPSTESLQSQAQCSQHRTHGGCLGIHVRGSESGSELLGTPCRKRSGRAPVQHGHTGTPPVLLARERLRSGFRSDTRSKARSL